MTNGCRWQEKSFSVSMAGKCLSICRNCSTPIMNTVYRHNGDDLCRACFNARPAVHIDNSAINGFLTTKDKLFDFIDVHTTGKPVAIRSKRQWEKHIKSLGLHDDINMKKFSKPENLPAHKDIPLDKDEMRDLMHRSLHDPKNRHLFGRNGIIR
ncbi:MAG: hypothetical protein PHQ22_10395 [Sulfuricurvum sp.]|nr:hypothetical protein [Sulfuricurvum sp.]